MKRSMIEIVLGMLALSTACSGSPTAPSGTVTFDFDFATRPPGWIAGSSDYSPAVQPGINLVADYRTLKAPLNEAQVAAYLQGENNSEDLFMFYKTRVTGLVTDGTYEATFSAEIATNVPYGWYGIPNSPGESAIIKAGASPREPERVLQGDYYVINISKGNGSSSGTDAVAIGDMANSIRCQPAPGGGILRIWELKSLNSAPRAVRTQAAPDGSIWLLIGLDSGTCCLVGVHITKFKATFERAD